MKKKSKKVLEAQPEVEIKALEKITFSAFFSQALNRQLVRTGQEKEILAFFKDLRLKEKEDLDTYLQALSKY